MANKMRQTLVATADLWLDNAALHAFHSDVHSKFRATAYWSGRTTYLAHTHGNCQKPLTCDQTPSAIWTEPIIARRR